MIKRFSGIVLIFSLLFNGLGYHFIFRYLENKFKKEIKQKIKSGIPESDLATIIISESEIENSGGEFVWVKENKEFRLHGQMYDIVRKEKKNDIFYFHCILDSQETTLFANLSFLINKKMSETESFPWPVFAISSLIIRQAEIYESLIISKSNQVSTLITPFQITFCINGFPEQEEHPPEI